jgi:hypothetical protein
MPSPRTYATAGAFRRALEERLKGISQADEIGEIYDSEEDDDADADGEDPGDTRSPERDEKRQGCFGSVSGGTEGVKAEDRDTCRWPDALFAILIGAQRRTEQEVKEGHASMIVSWKAQRS